MGKLEKADLKQSKVWAIVDYNGDIFRGEFFLEEESAKKELSQLNKNPNFLGHFYFITDFILRREILVD